MRKDRQRIGVIPIGDIPDIAPKVIAAHISGYLDLQTTLLGSMKNPSYALDRQRLQYNVGPIFQHLESRLFTSVDKVIGILDVDLFVPVFTHVFGEARQGGRVALISIFRLRENPMDTINDSAVALERAAKVALHELCHLYDLTHCENRQCLMHFSGSLSDLDQIPLSFCRY
ncbi:MAG TPA: zinc metallopeptidase, partial [Desulfobacteraceae bacterium]|nr:zinc metallopeptidase [Desulfobacteraceae bacterium]